MAEFFTAHHAQHTQAAPHGHRTHRHPRPQGHRTLRGGAHQARGGRGPLPARHRPGEGPDTRRHTSAGLAGTVRTLRPDSCTVETAGPTVPGPEPNDRGGAGVVDAVPPVAERIAHSATDRVRVRHDNVTVQQDKHTKLTAVRQQAVQVHKETCVF